MMIQNNMTINIRTPEEWNAFTKIGHAEGIRWLFEPDIALYERRYEAFSVHINDAHKALTSPFNYTENDYTVIVEASDLFRNHIISMRLKGG